jgi:hypothetical protein
VSSTPEDGMRVRMIVGPNPWDSLMVCGFSWMKAKQLVWAYAKNEGIRIPRTGVRTGPVGRWKRKGKQ